MAEEAAKSDAPVENHKLAVDDETSRQEQEKLVRDIEALRMKYNLGVKKPETSKEFKFWKTQPVPKLGNVSDQRYAGSACDWADVAHWANRDPLLTGRILDEQVDTVEPIEADKKPEEIKQDSLSLPAGYKWDTLDIEDAEIVIIRSRPPASASV